MLFEFNGSAVVKKIEPKRGSSDDARVSVQIKFHAEDFPAGAAAAALGADDASVVDSSFFRPLSQDADRNSKFPGLKWIDCEGSWDGKHALAIQGFRQRRVDKVGQVKIKPRSNGRFDARFSVTLIEPPENFIELLAERLNSSTKITLEQDKELDLQGGQSGKPAEAAQGVIDLGAAKAAKGGKPKPKRVAAKRPKSSRTKKAA